MKYNKCCNNLKITLCIINGGGGVSCHCIFVCILHKWAFFHELFVNLILYMMCFFLYLLAFSNDKKGINENCNEPKSGLT